MSTLFSVEIQSVSVLRQLSKAATTLLNSNLKGKNNFGGKTQTENCEIEFVLVLQRICFVKLINLLNSFKPQLLYVQYLVQSAK